VAIPILFIADGFRKADSGLGTESMATEVNCGINGEGEVLAPIYN
jgi:hypothetical protein